MTFPNKVHGDLVINEGFDIVQQDPSFVLPFGFDGNNRYFVLSDVSLSSSTASPRDTATLRMYWSADNGTNWSELDSTHAPRIADDNGHGTSTGTGTGPAPGVFQFYNCCADPTAQIIYTVYWSTNFNLAVKSFHVNTLTASLGTWGTANVSSIQYFNVSNNDPIAISGFLIDFRLSDSSIQTAWEDTDVQNGTITVTGGGPVLAQPTQIWGANLGTGGWGARTLLSNRLSTASDTTWYRPLAIKADSSSRIHIFSERVPWVVSTGGGSPVGVPGLGTLVHWAIASDNTIGADTTIDFPLAGTLISGVGPPSLYSTNGTDTLGITYSIAVSTTTTSNIKTVVGRAAAATSPVWTLETLTNINNSYPGNERVQPADIIRLGSLDYITWGHNTSTSGVISEFDYITSTGIGGAWSTATQIGTFSFAGTDGIGNRVVAAAFSTSSSFAIAMPFGTFWGEGYWEQAISPPPPPAGQIFFIPQYIKRHNAPGH